MFGIASYSGAPYSSLGDLEIVVALTGVQATGNIGTAAALAILGNEVNGAVGTVSVAERVIAISGVASSGTIQALTSTQILAGVQAGGAVGNVIARYWKLIDDSQTPNWQNITDSQTAGWALVNDNQTSNWQNLTTSQTAGWVVINDGGDAGWTTIPTVQ